jgi:soluble lytic murein transglycosylase-like protein
MGRFKFAAALVIALAALGTISASASTSAGEYVVQPGDTLWAISSSQHVDLGWLIRANNIQNPDRIYPGERLKLPDTSPPPNGIHGAAAKAIITAAARHHGLNPNFVLALSYWESGWNESTVSATGAVGLMQIEPYTADWAGPRFLGRTVDIHDATDNAELGAALLRHYLEVFNDPKVSLAAYYQGETATMKYGIYPSSRSYVDGIWALRNRFQRQGS